MYQTAKLLSAHSVLPTKITLLYRTKLFIGINVCEICDCQKSRKVKPTKT